MAPLISIKNLHFNLGDPPLINGMELIIGHQERIALVGRNGVGKSTLMNIIQGLIKPDDGVIQMDDHIKISRMQQEVPQNLSGDIRDVITSGLGEIGSLLAEYQQLSQRMQQEDMPKLEQLQDKLDHLDGWSLDARIDAALASCKLDGATPFESLSGGQKRQVLFAQALAQEPDLLLLDEPTNHLDIERILWLEKTLCSFSKSILLVTHDRAFLKRVATRIIEIDRGKLYDYPCDYDTFLRRREERLHAEEKAMALADKRLAQEEVWIRQGIKARRTRNEGRVRALEAMRATHKARVKKVGKVNFDAHQISASGKLVLEAFELKVSVADKTLVDGLDIRLIRGDKLAILGPNGCGKSTLVRTLLGHKPPTSGKVYLGTQLEVAYFDQLRTELDESQSVRDNVGGGSDFIEVNDIEKHIIAYLQDFLFSPERARQPVSALSGGEKNRLMLARLFTKPANLLVLDEPTNDLDLETLELLEQLLVEYKGTLILISHDRDFINHIATSTLVFEAENQVNEYVGGYDDWLSQKKSIATEKKPINKKSTQDSGSTSALSSSTNSSSTKKPPKNKLNYQEQRELDGLPKKIAKLEKDIEQLQAEMCKDDFFQQTESEIKITQQQLAEFESELAQVYERWEALEG